MPIGLAHPAAQAQVHTLTLLSLLIWSGLVGWSDLRRRIIPNALSLGSWVVGAGLVLGAGHAASGASTQSAGWATAFAVAVTLPAYVWRKLGAGDVKYLVGIALLTGWSITSACFAIAGGLGFGLVLLWWAAQRSTASLWLRAVPCAGHLLASWVEGFSRAPLRLPFGTLLSIGLWAALIFKVAS